MGVGGSLRNIGDGNFDGLIGDICAILIFYVQFISCVFFQAISTLKHIFNIWGMNGLIGGFCGFEGDEWGMY